MIEDKSRHRRTRFTRVGGVVVKVLRSPFFDSLEEIGGAYEIKERKHTVVIRRLINMVLLCINWQSCEC